MIEYGREHVKNSREELSEEFWRGRQWSVTAFGIEARDGHSVIASSRIIGEFASRDEHTILRHMAEKDWVDLDDFTTAWLIAIALWSRKGAAPFIAEQVRRAYKDRSRA